MRLRPLAIALIVPVLAACSNDSAAHLRAVPRGAGVARGGDPLIAAADSVRSLFTPLACDTVFLNTGYVATDPEGAVTRTVACQGGTAAAHGYFFRDPAGGRTLVSGRVFRTANHQSRRVADSIAHDIGTRNGAPTACVSLAWPQSEVARVWAANGLSVRVVADTETDDVTVERSVGAPDCDPSLFARYPEFPYR